MGQSRMADRRYLITECSEYSKIIRFWRCDDAGDVLFLQLHGTSNFPVARAATKGGIAGPKQLSFYKRDFRLARNAKMPTRVAPRTEPN